MKTIYNLLLIIIPAISFAQTAPEIEWQNTIGGYGDDKPEDIKATSDGGYIIAGSLTSDTSADKSESSIGELDCWVIKLDANGNIEWENTMFSMQISKHQKNSD